MPAAERDGFLDWVDQLVDPKWGLFPLTHVTRGLLAEDIVVGGRVGESDSPKAYLFYGRAAYRIAGDNVTKIEAACPCCFVFDSSLLTDADSIYAFDTGAFDKRLYKHVLIEDMKVEDFRLTGDELRANKLIAHVFGTKRAYFEGDRSQMIDPEKGAKPHQMLARAYLQLLSSPGRNEPDDRICSIEAVFNDGVALTPHLRAVVVPHTLWDNNDDDRAPWLKKLSDTGVAIRTYSFIPGRHPEHYHTLMELAVRDYFEEEGAL